MQPPDDRTHDHPPERHEEQPVTATTGPAQPESLLLPEADAPQPLYGPEQWVHDNRGEHSLRAVLAGPVLVERSKTVPLHPPQRPYTMPRWLSAGLLLALCAAIILACAGATEAGRLGLQFLHTLHLHATPTVAPLSTAP
jgi:hypothetical protein